MAVNTFAEAGVDYKPVMLQTSTSRESPVISETINLFKNPSNNKKRRFFFRLLGECGIEAWIEICILNYTGSEFSHLHNFVYYMKFT